MTAPYLNLTAFIFENAKAYMSKPALYLVHDDDSSTVVFYHQLMSDILSLIGGIQTLGLPYQSIVCIQAEEVYDFILLFLACNGAGLVPCPILMGQDHEEVLYILGDTKAVAFFCIGTMPVSVSQTRLILKEEYAQLRHGKPGVFESTKASEYAFLCYTSGSSGYPKGVLHAHHVILGRLLSIQSWLVLKHSDMVMQTDNLCWTYSLFTGLLDPLIVGATAVIVTSSNRSSLSETQTNPNRWLQLIANLCVTIFATTPDLIQSIIDIPHQTLSSLRQVGVAGGFLTDTLQKNWVEKFKIPLDVSLGMTEISTFISTGPDVPYRSHKIGKVQPGRKVAVLPMLQGFVPLLSDEEGMLAVHRSELGLMHGYLHDDHCEDHYRGEWFLTQDIVCMDEDGYIEYRGRADLILKVGSGFRVSPLEVERILLQSSNVIEAVCGVRADERHMINILIAYIVVYEASLEKMNMLVSVLKLHLTDYKVPKYLYVVESLPKNKRNKILRSKLSELLPLQKIEILDNKS